MTSGNMTVYFNKRGAMDEVQSYYSFHLVPDFHTPDWAKGAVFYQTFVDRFCNGDPSNDVVNIFMSSRRFVRFGIGIVCPCQWM